MTRDLFLNLLTAAALIVGVAAVVLSTRSAMAGEALSGDCDCLCQECGITCCLDGGECAEAEACCLVEGCCRDAIDTGCDCPACDCPDCGEACCVGGDCEADDCCTAAGCCAA